MLAKQVKSVVLFTQYIFLIEVFKGFFLDDSEE